MSDEQSESKLEQGSPVNGALSLIVRLLGRQAAREALAEITVGKSTDRLQRFRLEMSDG